MPKGAVISQLLVDLILQLRKNSGVIVKMEKKVLYWFNCVIAVCLLDCRGYLLNETDLKCRMFFFLPEICQRVGYMGLKYYAILIKKGNFLKVFNS